jgi:hypothetical protein
LQLKTVVVRQGFAILPEMLTKYETQVLAGELVASKLPKSRAGIRHALKYPAVRDLANDPRLLNSAGELLGSAAVPFRATLFDKSGKANWLVVWHQDTALPLRERREVAGWGPWSVKDALTYAHAPAKVLENVIALRVHLDESNANNGPLRVLPGTHTNGLLTDDQICDLAKQLSSVDCLVPEGGVLAMRPLIVHASSKCESDSPRRVLHVEYAPSLNIGDGLELAIA